MITRQASRSPLLRMPSVLAVTSLILLSVASCSPHLATAPRVQSIPGTQASLATTIGTVDNQLVITVPPGADVQSIADAYGATVLAYEQGVAVLQPPPVETVDDLESRMRGDTRVLTAERNMILRTAEVRQKSWSFDDGFGSALTVTNQPTTDALAISTAHGVVPINAARVAILDTGIDPNHPMLKSLIADGWDFVDGDAQPTDVLTGLDLDGDGVPDGAYGHGTHVAGIVALTAPGAKLLIARVLDSEGRGDLRTVAAGIRWAVAKGAKVINMSLGALRSSNTIALAIHDAETRGVVCVVSAGNWGSDSPVDYPASSSEVIAVGALDPLNYPASFSSYGSFVDICAPGVAVRSAFPGGGYRLWSGTSMAAPWVSGTVALVKNLHPDWGLPEMLSLLRSSAHPIYGLASTQRGLYGCGALSVLDALYMASGAFDAVDRVEDDVQRQP